MEWKDVLGELVQFVTGMAPELWRIAYRQAITRGVATACMCGLSILAAVYFRVLAKRLQGEERDTARIGMVGTIGAALVSGLIAMSYFVNPDYYTIKILLDLIK